MKNLYVFAIGGSGERVMRSFIMLLAAGVKLGADVVHPIFVDNDEKSMALKRCRDLIKYYNTCADNTTDSKVGIGTICQGLDEPNRPSFFQTKIEAPTFLNIAGDTIGNLESIIGKGLSKDKDVEMNILEERDLLFSKDDLEMKLTVGFVGNPNIGSIVLNALSFSDPQFDDIVQKVGNGDGIMVVGSLFGGTGAAGLPLIINKFKRRDGARPTIGGVAVLPYFNFDSQDQYPNDQKIIDTEKWDVNSDSFSVKTRTALMYYDSYMDNMDYLYYVGDDNRANYTHYVGGIKQDNPVHLVELLGAMSIIDFSKQQNVNNIIYKQPIWGISNSDGGNPTVCNIDSFKNPEIKRAIVKFQMLRELFINTKEGFLAHSIENESPFVKDIKFTESIRKACVGESPKKLYTDVDTFNNCVVQETSNYGHAWGLNAFFKEWVLWCADLNGSMARRTLSIFPNANEDIDKDNITQKFYSENQSFGIAKTKIKRPLFGTPREVPVEPKITDNLLVAHRKLGWRETKDKDILAVLLKTISDGLDKVLDDSSTI